MDLQEIKRLMRWSDKQRPEIMALLVKAEQAEQGWATASAACNRVAGERDRLTAQLTSAKEEGAALIESQMQRAEAAEAALSAERKETERLRGYESVVKHNAEYQKGYDEGRRLERIEAERLTYELNQIFGMACDAPELNMSNYDVDQVAALNAAMVEIWQIAKAALQERQGEQPFESICRGLEEAIEWSKERQGEE